MKALLLSLMLAIAIPASSQSLWTSAGAKGQITKRLSVSAEAEYRTTDQLKATDRWDIGVGAQLRIMKWLSAGVGFTFIDQREPLEVTKKGNIIPSYWQPKYRYSVGLTGSYTISRLELSLREQVQFTHRTSQYVSKYSSSGAAKDDEYISSKTKTKLRSRLKAEYNIPKCPLTPFASFEIYNSLNDDMHTDKIRVTAGADWRINKHNYIELYYRYIDHSDDDEPHGNIIGVGYTYKFRF
ncbi:MAG: DUF2490 domain-containing protein [Bacteroidales bacterium]|nr:DUF2490 domain-containing protein [Bacteroidales bacterium]